MKMTVFIPIFWILLNITAFAQMPEAQVLRQALADLDNAMISRGTAMLKRLLSDKISYGHSNSWLQTKRDIINDLYNGKLTYKTISPKDEQITLEQNTASVRLSADIDVMMDGKPLQFKLKVLQVWVWKTDHWELFARQSVKL